jgi:hypothetical protein
MRRINREGIPPTPFGEMWAQRGCLVALWPQEAHKQVPLCPVLAAHAPETVLEVPLGHEDHHGVVILGLCKGVDDLAECMPKLIKCPFWCHLYCHVVDREKYSTIGEAEAEG